MRQRLDAFERHCDLVPDEDRHRPGARFEVPWRIVTSAHRHLKPAAAADEIKGVSTSKASALLRSSIVNRRAAKKFEAEPGF